IQETRYGIEAPHGVVASDAPLASNVGVEIMRAGGNAVDAAVATGFALAVVYPEAGNLGGGGFTVIRMADGRTASIDYREVAPLSAARTMFLDDSGRATDKSVVGPLASGVPGSVAGLVAQHQRFGVLPLARVMAPAIRLAEQGFTVDSQFAQRLHDYQRLAGRYAGAALLYPGGQPLALGSLLRQPALARTLRMIADSGAAAFYTGGLSHDVAADLRNAGAIITAEDLARYTAEWREPLRATYRGHPYITMPPPGSGATLVEALNILEGFDLGAFGSARGTHLVASALQRAFIDRNALLGDPAFVRVPLDRLTSKSYATLLRAGIQGQAVSTPTVTAAMHEGQHTTHYSVVDAEGNAVATTTTLNDLYGSGVYLPTVGIFMNDEMDDFAANPGKPNMFGLVQGEQNAVQPGKRMLSSMIPTIVLDDAGRPLLVLGARGGPRIISAVLQTMVNVLDHQMTLADAMTSGRVHHQALPDTLRYEPGSLSPAVLDSLGTMGYALKTISGVASVNAVLRTAHGWAAYSDPRSGGKPAGY
ncbi:MAG TPA: gamma-glutamyltransferase, partial [Gemmatimonadaceae bacterium]|nr:gamma-glutamyltransferase [Gemmatimonadaceae bacterium]